MTRWQFLRYLAEKIKGFQFDDAEPLVRTVDITAISPEGVVPIRFTPCILLITTSSRPVTKNQDEEYSEFEITLCWSLENSDSLESSLMGAGKGSDKEGILKNPERILKSGLKLMTEKEGFQFDFLGSGAGSFTPIQQGNNSLVSCTYRYQGRTTIEPTYLSPIYLRNGTPVGAVVIIVWQNPTQVPDLKKIVLRRSDPDGSAPQTILEGNSVSLSSNLATSKIDTVPSTGASYWYSVFAQYDNDDIWAESGDDADLYTSDPFSWRVDIP